MESSMLVKGNIPHSEPTIAIGLVLPEDHQTELMLSFSNLNAFKFLLDGSPVVIAESDLTIRVQNNELAINGHQTSEIWCVPLMPDNDDYIQLDSVRVGRGFHWEKNIKITIPGDLKITLKDGKIFVVNQGKIVDEGRHLELLKNSLIYQDFYNKQLKHNTAYHSSQ